MSERRVAYETARLRLVRYRLEGDEARARAAMHATQVCAEALGAHRVGVWMFTPRRQALACVMEYDAPTSAHGRGGELALAGCAAYLGRLEEQRVVVVDDVRSHAAMSELARVLRHDVRSTLEAPIVREGHTVGVLRAEHTELRTWSHKDAELVSSVADMVTSIIEQAERLQLEAALQVQTEERHQQQKMEALGRMASAIVHDFNNVLNSLLLAAQSAPAAPVEDTVDVLRRTVGIGKRLTSKLIAFAGEGPREGGGHCSVVHVIQEMMPVLETSCGHQVRIALRHSIEAIVPLGVTEAEQIVLNIVLNARDAIDGTGQIEITVDEVGPSDDAPPGSVILRFSDTGAGMDDATRTRIFEPFFTTKPTGTGLGLSTVFGIVGRIGGTVRADSERGRGTTVTLVLPGLVPS